LHGNPTDNMKFLHCLLPMGPLYLAWKGGDWVGYQPNQVIVTVSNVVIQQ